VCWSLVTFVGLADSLARPRPSQLMEEDRRLIDLKGQCESKCWIIGHLQLTPEECEMYKGIPVVYDDELVSMPCHLGFAFVRT
jgi:hypothetical protein